MIWVGIGIAALGAIKVAWWVAVVARELLRPGGRS